MSTGPNTRAGEGGHNLWPTGSWSHETRAVYLANLAATGRKTHSARMAGVSLQTVRNNKKLDPTLEEDESEAMEVYKDSVREEIHRRGIVGVEEPLHYQGAIFASVKKYSDRLLELEAKRLMPEYREKQQLDITHKGGVLVVPHRPAEEDEPLEDWVSRANHSLKRN